MTETIWQDVECGSYAADLPLWEELAGPEASDVLDLGCGTGRVAIRLAQQGHRVTGLDLDPAFMAETAARALAHGVDVETVEADARSFRIDRQFDLILAPMQLVQLFNGAQERKSMLRSASAHLRPGGLFAGALMELQDEPLGDEYLPPLPDMREVDGWVYSSQPVGLRHVDGGNAISLDRVRTTVAPSGKQTRSATETRLELLSPEEFEREVVAVGLGVIGRRFVSPTDDHVGSIVVIARAPRPVR
jgi:SAM-dependent methyltransferase